MHYFSARLMGAAKVEVEAQVVQAQLGVSLSGTLESIYNLPADVRLRTEMLIVRLPVEESCDFQALANPDSAVAKRHLGDGKAERNRTFARARDRSVHLLGSYNGQLFVSRNLNPHWSSDPFDAYDLAPATILDAIRRDEIEHILDRSRAVLTLPQGSQYLAPSRRRIQSFVRVGNIQYSRDAIEAVTFWLLPHLKGIGAIVTDTWSISSIAFSAARLAAAYFGGPTPRVEMLPSYNDGSETARLSARRVLERLDRDSFLAEGARPGLLCLISATQSGRLAGHLRGIIETSQLNLQPSFVSLFRLGPSELATLHDLSEDPRFQLLPDSEGEVERASQPVRIDPQVYFPLSFQDEVMTVDIPIADRSRDFFERYRGAGLIQVHRDHQEADGPPLHHGIHLATERLLKHSDFVKRFENRLGKLQTAPALIVSPPHGPGQALAQHAQAYFRRKGEFCAVFPHSNLQIPPEPARDEERELRTLLRDAGENQSLLIIDDVCISGARLSQYQRHIRNERFKGRIDYLVGVARPNAESVWAYYERYLRYRAGHPQKHTLQAVEKVILPDWREHRCPWCAEKQLYHGWSRRAPLPELLLRRLEQLTRSSQVGLEGDLFLQRPGAPPFILGPDSIYVSEKASQAEVFAAIAAALQVLRTERFGPGPTLGPRRFPISTVLKHEDYCVAKFTDSILRASMLRAAAADELIYADPQTELARTEALRRLVTRSSEGEHEIALELLIAAGEEKCRIDDSGDLRCSLRGHGFSNVTDYILDRVAELSPL